MTVKTLQSHTSHRYTPSHALSLDLLREFGVEPVASGSSEFLQEDNSDQIKKLRIVIRNIVENELTDLQRQVVIFRMSGLQTQQIAKEMGITSATVSRHYKRGMARLKRIGQYISPFLR